MSASYRDDDRIVIGRLRREGRATCPAFSEDLHERLCRVIERSKVSRRVASRSAGRARSMRWAAALIAAACLAIAAVPLAWQAGLFSGETAVVQPVLADRIESSTPKEESRPPSVPPATDSDAPHDFERVSAFVDETADQVTAFVESTIAEQQFAYLDHDARLAIEGIAAQLPFDLPLNLAWGEPAGETEP